MRVVNVRDYAGRQQAEAAGVVYVGRPGVLGNPYTVEAHGRDECIQLYRRWLWERIKAGDHAIMRALGSLNQDSVIGCHCKRSNEEVACHGDVIVQAWQWLKTQEESYA